MAGTCVHNSFFGSTTISRQNVLLLLNSRITDLLE